MGFPTMCDIACLAPPANLLNMLVLELHPRPAGSEAKGTKVQEIQMHAEKDYLEVTVCEPVFVF